MWKATRVYGEKSPTQKANAISSRHRDSSLNGMKAEPLQPRFHGIDQVQASKYVPRKADSIKYEIVARKRQKPDCSVSYAHCELARPFLGPVDGRDPADEACTRGAELTRRGEAAPFEVMLPPLVGDC